MLKFMISLLFIVSVIPNNKIPTFNSSNMFIHEEISIDTEACYIVPTEDENMYQVICCEYENCSSIILPKDIEFVRE